MSFHPLGCIERPIKRLADSAKPPICVPQSLHAICSPTLLQRNKSSCLYIRSVCQYIAYLHNCHISNILSWSDFQGTLNLPVDLVSYGDCLHARGRMRQQQRMHERTHDQLRAGNKTSVRRTCISRWS